MGASAAHPGRRRPPRPNERQWLAPVLAAFVRGLPRALSDAPAPEGATVRLIIGGEAGGEWVARKDRDVWTLGVAADMPADATVLMDQETAWRLFTKGIAKDDARQNARVAGDPALAARVFDTVSILA